MERSKVALLVSEQERALNQREVISSESLEDHETHRSLGFVPTPQEVVSFMVELAAPNCHESCDVLEPACGDARFLSHFLHRHGENHRYIGVEINRDMVEYARLNLHPRISLINADFLLWDTSERFDVIIGNPPYGIIGDKSHYPIHSLKERKAEYKRRITTWKGKYNLYAAFVERAVELLKPRGKLVFIIPTTWLILDDFSILRKYLSRIGRLEVFYVGRVFPKVNVSAVVLRLTKGEHGLVLYDMADGRWKNTTLNEYIPFLEKPVYQGELIRFETPQWLEFERNGKPLGDLFYIRFAARSPEFRKSGMIRTEPLPGDVPVLTGRNLSPGCIDYERSYSKWWMRREDAVKLRSFYGVPHLVVGHTKGARLVCAVDWQCYPWREEYHLLPRQGVKVDWIKLESYLNSEKVQMYLKSLYRDLSPHLTKTMLSFIPIPEEMVDKSTDCALL